MKADVSFAKSDQAFSTLVNAVRLQLDVDRRLPDWPFLQPTGFATIYEFDRVLGGSFGKVLEALAKVYGDHDVAIVGLEPLASYYRDTYRFFPGFKLGSAGLAESYVTAMYYRPDNDPTGSLGHSLNVMGITGSSGCWSVWGQRDWEIALLLAADADGPWLSATVPSYGRDIDLDSIRSPAGWGVPLSDAALSTFWRNVGERGSGS